MTLQTQWYRSGIKFGTLGILPCYPNATLDCPDNYDVPPILGNAWQVNYGPGLKQPYITVQLAIRDYADGVLNSSSGLLYYLLARDSSDVASDNSFSLGTVEFWDGRSRALMTSAKLDALTLSCTKGGPISCTARLCGNGLLFDTTNPGVAGWNAAKILRFPAITFNGNLANKVWQFNLSYTNNHNPDLTLDGTEFPYTCDAGMRIAGFSVVVQAADGLLNSQLGPVAHEDSASFNIAGTGRSLTLGLSRLINNTPKNRVVSVPRNMRAYQYISLGTDGVTAPPLVVVSHSGF